MFYNMSNNESFSDPAQSLQLGRVGSCFYHGGEIWNDLPAEVRNIDNNDEFKNYFYLNQSSIWYNYLPHFYN